MKRLFLIIPALAIMAGCSGPARHRSAWPGVDAEGDRLIDSLEQVWRGEVDGTTLARLDSFSTLLEQRADAAGIPALKPRSDFWRFMVYNNTPPRLLAQADSLAQVALERGWQEVDSGADPYTWARLALVKSWRMEPQERYRTLFAARDIFRTYRDTLQLANAINRIAGDYSSAYDYKEATRHYLTAYRLLANSTGNERWWAGINAINTAEKAGDTAVVYNLTDSILLLAPRDLLNYRANAFLYTNKFKKTGRREYLDTLLAMNPRAGETAAEWARPYALSLLLGEELSSAGYDRHRADSLDRAIDTLRISGRPHYGDVLAVQERYARAKGDRHRADTLAAERLRLEREMSELQLSAAQLSAASRAALQALDRQVEHEQERNGHLTVWVVLAAVLVLVLSVVIVWRNRRHKRMTAVMADENQSDKARLAIAQLQLQQKDKALSSALAGLGKMKATTPETSSRAAALSSMIKASMGSEDDWEKFNILFAQADPRFVKNLTERYPDLTKGEIRLALLLRVGLNTKEISRLLGIVPDSVKKNRQRLRAHLGIPSDQQFHTFFRELD